jgi:hypothetical protein
VFLTWPSKFRRTAYARTLEDAIKEQNHQWPKQWAGQSPIAGGKSFKTMAPSKRLDLLHTLMLWSLTASQAVQAILKESYKQSRANDDLNQPLSIQPWGKDGDRRKYYLIEGQDDTFFRLYKENPSIRNHTWWSVASSIPELQTIVNHLQEEPSQASRRLSERITNAIPRFEAGEEKRRRREYRMNRRMMFTRPEPGFSMYEGRTRGKRIRYTYSDEEEGNDLSDSGDEALGTRRSTRQRDQRGQETQQSDEPTFTASGRQVKNRVGGVYGESLTTASHADDYGDEGDDSAMLDSTQNLEIGERSHIDTYNKLDEMSDEASAASFNPDEENDDDEESYAGDGEVSEDEAEDGNGSGAEARSISSRSTRSRRNANGKRSLVVSLRYTSGSTGKRSSPIDGEEEETKESLSQPQNGVKHNGHSKSADAGYAKAASSSPPPGGIPPQAKQESVQISLLSSPPTSDNSLDHKPAPVQQQAATPPPLTTAALPASTNNKNSISRSHTPVQQSSLKSFFAAAPIKPATPPAQNSTSTLTGPDREGDVAMS